MVTYNRFAPHLPLSTSLEWHLARRAAIAPTQSLVDEIKKVGYAKWIDQQLDWQNIPDPVMNGILNTHFSVLERTAKEHYTITNGNPWMTAPIMMRSIYLRHIYSNRYIHDSMAEFFSDILYVAGPSSKSDSFVADFNRMVIRPYALGRFSDMLHASLTHPAMLLYLDNHISTKDKPNENLGRELLELHTVGVGNYSETDVMNSTKLLTGHGFDWGKMAYTYNDWAHYVGPVKIMGFSHPNQNSTSGPDVLKAYSDYLAKHPKTALRIATRLYARFVADVTETPLTTGAQLLIRKMANVYITNGTDIRPVLKTLFNSPHFKQQSGQKWRRPQESISTMVRQGNPVGYVPNSDILQNPWDYGNTGWSISNAGHFPRSWAAVDGYPDRGENWLTSNVHKEVMNAAENVAFRWNPEIKYNATLAQTYNIKAGQNAIQKATELTLKLTGYNWSAKNIAVIASWLANKGQAPVTSTTVIPDGDIDYNVNEAIRLIWASPYFMAR